MRGSFQISREIFNHSIWEDPIKFRLFFYILGNAIYSEEGITHAGIHLKRGQYLRSYRRLQEDLSYKEGRGNALKVIPTGTLQRKIKSLVNEGRIEVKSTEYGTLFTVVNYATYQGFERYEKRSMEQQWNSNGTAVEQRWNNTKKDKKDKNDKKESSPKYNFEQHHLKLAELLFKKIKENNPNAKEPNIESWANTIRLIMERDKREGKELQELIIWTQQHEFWYQNILSPTNLRKQYDRLLIQMKDDKKLKLVNGGMKHAEGSYQTDYTKYDFSKQGNVSWLPDRS